MGFPIVDSGQSSPLSPVVALNDTDGTQDLFVEDGDPLWVLESSSTRNKQRITLWIGCQKVVQYTRPSTDTLFPVSGSGPNYLGDLYHFTDGDGNFYWVGIRFLSTDAGGAYNIRIRMVDLSGSVSTATLDARDYAPATLVAPDTDYLFDGSGTAGGECVVCCPQESGFLVLVNWGYSKGAAIKTPAGVIKVDSSLSATGEFVPWASPLENQSWGGLSLDPKPIPMPDGFVANQGSKTYRFASDASIVSSVTKLTALDSSVGYEGVLSGDNWFVTEDEKFYWYNAATYAIERYDLTTLASDSLGWSTVDDVRSFVVSASGDRIATHEWDQGESDPAYYRVYDNAGTLLLEIENETPLNLGQPDYPSPAWPCERHNNPTRYDGYQHAADGRLCFVIGDAGTGVSYVSDRARVAKQSLDSILAVRLLAIETLTTVSIPFMCVRGQWPHFTYASWS